MNKTNEERAPFGDEGGKEMMKFSKKALVAMLGQSRKNERIVFDFYVPCFKMVPLGQTMGCRLLVLLGSF